MRNYIDDAAVNRQPSPLDTLSFLFLKFSGIVGVLSLSIMVALSYISAALIVLATISAPIWVLMLLFYESYRMYL